MSKVNCGECQFYNAGRCKELGEYTTPGERECSWFSQMINKKPCFAKCEKSAKQTFFHQITQSPEVLAEEFIHLEYDRSKDECGFTSQYLEEIFIIKEQEGKNHEEKYFNARNKALAATVAKLKEVEE